MTDAKAENGKHTDFIHAVELPTAILGRTPPSFTVTMRPIIVDARWPVGCDPVVHDV
jgi:hypothetical protein